jgi:hypothetical protein
VAKESDALNISGRKNSRYALGENGMSGGINTRHPEGERQGREEGRGNAPPTSRYSLTIEEN